MALQKREDVKEVDKWDLTPMYTSYEDWEKDIQKVTGSVKEVAAFKGRIMESSSTLYEFYLAYDKMNRISDLVYLYARLLCDGDTTNSEYQKMKSRVEKMMEDISTELSFVSSEMLSADYSTILEYIKENPKLEEFAFDLEKMFRYKDHTLSEKEEEIITKASNAFGTGDEVFYNFDNADIHLGEITNEDGELEEVTNSNYIKLMNSKNRQVRKDAFEHMYHYFESFKNTISSAYKGQIKEDFFMSDIRKYPNPLEMSLYYDSIDSSVYKNLIQTVHDNMNVMYDYMALRKKVLGLDEMHMYDVYVDIVDATPSDIPFEEGKKILFEALRPLGDTYLSDLQKAFDERWIDKYPNVGKKSGAYSWGSYDTYPYLLLNYNGTVDSVSTMGHELGHSMHSYYSNKYQNSMNANYPIFLAEIASTVNEVLINDYLYKNAKTKQEKMLYLTEFLDKVRTTIYRQTMFAEFEMIMHDKYEQNIPITEEELSSTYYDLNKLYYGDNMISDDLIRYEWLRIPHFYTPFYVYKYATGLSSAIAIASDILKGKEGAKEAYLEFLRSGCSDYPLNILKKAGVDMTTPEPISKAITMFEEKLKELQELI